MQISKISPKCIVIVGNNVILIMENCKYLKYRMIFFLNNIIRIFFHFSQIFKKLILSLLTIVKTCQKLWKVSHLSESVEVPPGCVEWILNISGSLRVAIYPPPPFLTFGANVSCEQSLKARSHSAIISECDCIFNEVAVLQWEQ